MRTSLEDHGNSGDQSVFLIIVRPTNKAPGVVDRGPWARVAMVAALMALASLIAASGASAAKRTVPFGFMGVDFEPALVAPEGLDAELGRMAATGAESLRTALYWRDAQPYASFADVPAAERDRFRDVGGVPTDFSSSDRIVAAAARHGIRLSPVVLLAPAWAAEAGTAQPRDPATFGRFMAALVARYGPDGSLWSDRPALSRVPIRRWQIWNEPNLRLFWQQTPWPQTYVALLRAAAKAIRGADRGARVVLGGMVNFSWTNLGLIYAAGGRGSFDEVAIHPYTARIANVIRIVRLVRKVMRRYHDDRAGITLTELSWPSSGQRTSIRRGFETTEAGQAKRLSEAYAALVAARRRYRIESVFWYSWLSKDRSRVEPFDYAGLRKIVGLRIVDKPALRAYARSARSVEGCAKSTVATRCR